MEANESNAANVTTSLIILIEMRTKNISPTLLNAVKQMSRICDFLQNRGDLAIEWFISVEITCHKWRSFVN